MKLLYLELQELPVNEVAEYREALSVLKENIDKFRNNFFPATKYYECFEKLSWFQNHEGKLKGWHKRTISIFSMCKLYEGLIHTALPKLQQIAKGIPHNVYGNFSNTKR
eukprot:TRINITY_DN515_c0_g1_i6.p3 TRINITY_DN515_c0_g1~~TRINITY_DN515_c0_g1_i6.p3  ORF type:complete len:109 (-),score=19.95 TRINITY_DN515_c0_g1_i6:1133-1459(-)